MRCAKSSERRGGQQAGLAATGETMRLICLDRLDMSGRRKISADHRRLGLAVGLGHYRTEHVHRLAQFLDRHGRGGVDEIFQRRIVVVAHLRVREHHVDRRRRQKQVGHAVFFVADDKPDWRKRAYIQLLNPRK